MYLCLVYFKNKLKICLYIHDAFGENVNCLLNLHDVFGFKC